jgi:hypothetical protein
MKIHTDFKTIPMGLFLLKMVHESTGGEILHIGLKVRDAEWYEQARCPVYSEDASKMDCADFWRWASENLPVYEYRNIVKRATA